MHFNPGNSLGYDKTQGHLGSELHRKAQTNLRVTKDSKSEVVTACTSDSRRAMIKKEDGPSFKWDAERHMHLSCANG